MAGGIVIAVILVVVLPVVVLMSGAVASGLLGWLVNRRVDDVHEDSELLAVAYPEASTDASAAAAAQA